MRRPLLPFFLCMALGVGVGCGIDVVASKTFETPAEGGIDGSPNLPPADETGVADSALVDAPGEGDAVRQDAGVAFAPSHIAPVYSLAAAAVVVTSASIVDTSNRTLALNGAAPVVSPDIVFSDGAAVWSVDSLTIGAPLTVTGDRPLVIVARHDVMIDSTVAASGKRAVAGPGGSLPAAGAGKGANGSKPGMNDASGGGGAGHGTDGNVGGDKGAVKGGALGATVNAAGALLGGSGGGHGGGYVAGICGDQGRGGAGGGALQISTAGRIVVGALGGIDVGGGGGTGGCKSTGGDKRTGGGGGGAGGLVFLEAVEGITIAFGANLEASGGGGGGGGSGSPGGDGQDGPYPIGTAGGGSGNGGNGGIGGNGSAGALPQAGASGGETGGGGGGATGRVFLRTRGATPSVSGFISAQRTDDPTF